MTIKIDYDKCCWKDGKCTSCSCEGACDGCVEICPVDALVRKDLLTVDDDLCISCGSCIEACKHGAISLV